MVRAAHPSLSPHTPARSPRSPAGPGRYSVDDPNLLYTVGAHHRPPSFQFGRTTGRRDRAHSEDAGVCARTSWRLVRRYSHVLGVCRVWGPSAPHPSADGYVEGDILVLSPPRARPDAARTPSALMPRAPRFSVQGALGRSGACACVLGDIPCSAHPPADSEGEGGMLLLDVAAADAAARVEPKGHRYLRFDKQTGRPATVAAAPEDSPSDGDRLVLQVTPCGCGV